MDCEAANVHMVFIHYSGESVLIPPKVAISPSSLLYSPAVH